MLSAQLYAVNNYQFKSAVQAASVPRLNELIVFTIVDLIMVASGKWGESTLMIKPERAGCLTTEKGITAPQTPNTESGAADSPKCN
jgi:hypothetical protein